MGNDLSIEDGKGNGSKDNNIDPEEAMYTRIVAKLMKMGALFIDRNKHRLVARFIMPVAFALNMMLDFLSEVFYNSSSRLENDPNNSIARVVYDEIVSSGIRSWNRLCSFVRRLAAFFRGLYDLYTQPVSYSNNNFNNHHGNYQNF